MNIPLFSLENNIVVFWHLIMCFILTLQIVILPLKFSFEIDFWEDQRRIFFYFIPSIFMFLDIFFNLNIAFYEVDYIKYKKKKI
jgi:hypothetical protein